MDSLIMDYLQSIKKEERQITFKEECQGVCKDDSSSTVTHVCPHHQLQVLFCFVGHLHDNRTSQLNTQRDSSVLCPCPRELSLAFPMQNLLLLFLLSSLVESSRKSRNLLFSFQAHWMIFKQVQGARHRRSQAAPGSVLRHQKAHPSMQMQGEIWTKTSAIF